MASARLAGLYGFGALVVTLAWLRLESPHAGAAREVALVLLALLPTLVRPIRARIGVALVVVAAAVPLALRSSPFHPGQLGSRLGNGILEFYDVVLPFDPHVHPRMHDAVLFAILVFCLALALALAARRPFLACAGLVLGAGWPGTLLRGGNQLLIGALILLAVLAIVAGLRPRAVRAAVPGGVAVAAVQHDVIPSVSDANGCGFLFVESDLSHIVSRAQRHESRQP